MPRILSFFAVFDMIICYIQSNWTKWLFISLLITLNTLRVATILTIVLNCAFIFGATNRNTLAPFGRITIFLYSFLQAFALSARRFGDRYFRCSRVPSILLPSGADDVAVTELERRLSFFADFRPISAG